MYEYNTTLRVRYAEADPMNVVYYGNYAQYFEVGRVESLRSLGISYKTMEEIGFMLPVVELNIKYLRPAKYDDLITIKSMINDLVKISGKDITITWDSTKPNGDLRRQMDVSKQKSYNLLPSKPFVDALKKTYFYYISQFQNLNLNFNVKDFLKKGYYIGNSNELFKNINEFNDKCNLVISSSIDKSNYLYRFEYGIYDGVGDYKRNITLDEIPLREQFIKDNTQNLKSIEFFDLYFEDHQENTLNLGLRFIFQSYTNTLTTEFIEKELKTILMLIEKNYLTSVFK